VIIDKKLVKQKFIQSISTYDKNATVQIQMAENLIMHIKNNIDATHFSSALEIGCGTGLLTSRIIKHFNIDKITCNDLAADFKEKINSILKNNRSVELNYSAFDAEDFSKIQGVHDLVISGATFQWFEDLQRFLFSLPKVLNRDGILAFSTFGSRNLLEIRDLTGVGLSYQDPEELKLLFPPEFEIIYDKTEIIELEFSSPRDVLKHLTLTGVTGLSDKKLGKNDFLKFSKEYREKFSIAEKLILTYNPTYIIARRR